MSPAAAIPAPALPNSDTGADGPRPNEPMRTNPPNKNAEAHLAFPERKV